MNKTLFLKRFFLVSLFVVCLCPMAYSQVEIVLVSGGVITAQSYFEENDEICTHRFGQLIRIPKHSVIEIRTVEKNDGFVQVAPDPSSFPTIEEEISNDNANRQEGISNYTSVTHSDQTPKQTMNECEQKLKMFKKQMAIYCEEARSRPENIPRAPNLPNANRTTVSGDTFNKLKAHVVAKRDSAESSKNCDYYKGMVEHWEKECH
jgi:hypothetical protein